MSALLLVAKNECQDSMVVARSSKALESCLQQHLLILFNTKQGSLPYARTFGLPDLTKHLLHWPYASKEIAEIIQECIIRDEPRLSQVAVIARVPETIFHIEAFFEECAFEWHFKLSIYDQRVTYEK